MGELPAWQQKRWKRNEWRNLGASGELWRGRRRQTPARLRRSRDACPPKRKVAYARARRRIPRRIPKTPASPVPNKSMVAGSGTG